MLHPQLPKMRDSASHGLDAKLRTSLFEFAQYLRRIRRVKASPNLSYCLGSGLAASASSSAALMEAAFAPIMKEEPAGGPFLKQAGEIRSAARP